MKVLISAYSCEPGQGSERGVGWHVARAIANHHEVWVLTRPDESMEAIEAELAARPVPNLHFIYSTTALLGGLWKLGASGAMQLHYYLWQLHIYAVAQALHQEIGFDIVHHVTFVRYANPSFLSLLSPPFVWGPVGGGESTPQGFWQDFSLKNRLYETLRLAWRQVGEWDRFTHLTARRSAITYATTKETTARLKVISAKNIEILPAIALLNDEIEQLSHSRPPDQNPVRFISIARLIYWKGLHLSLRAFAKARSQGQLEKAEYWIIGDGAEHQRLKDLTAQLNIGSQVTFMGEIPRSSVLEQLAEASVLLHPSLHDSGAGVCLEAMAAGRPVICLDIGGPAQQVIPETGITIAVNSRVQAITDIAKAMVTLAHDPALRCRMGKAGRQRVKASYTWSARGQAFAEAYTTLQSFSKDIQ